MLITAHQPHVAHNQPSLASVDRTTTANGMIMEYSTLANPKLCGFEGCGRKHYANGLCHTHYNQQQRGLELRPIRAYASAVVRQKSPCSFDPCDKPSRVGGLCSGHRNQSDKGRELTPLRPRRTNGTTVNCSFEGCENNTNGGAFGLCKGHNRQRRLGRELYPLPEWNDARARDDQGRKCCGTCREWLDVTSFHKDANRSDGLNSVCKSCLRMKMLADKYNITVDQYDLMLSAQGGGCAVCGVTESADGSSLAVDHDHGCCPGERACGLCVRGLLCRDCNQGLGLYRDRPDLLRAAASYLELRAA